MNVLVHSYLKPLATQATPQRSSATAVSLPPSQQTLSANTAYELPRFGQYTYRHILLDLAPAAQFTPEQQRVFNLIESMAQAPNTQQLETFLNGLKSLEYKHLVNVVHKVRPNPNEPIKITMRDRFHTPWPDFALSLWKQPQRVALINDVLQGLKGTLQRSQQEDERRNAIEALVDIYFYCLRPNGKFTPQPDQSTNRFKNELKEVRKEALLTFQTLLTQTQPPIQLNQASEFLKTQRQLRNELVFALRDMQTKGTPQVRRVVRKEIIPAVQAPLGIYAKQALPTEPVKKLRQAIKTGDIPTLKAMITSGEMKTLIPEWERVGSTDNHQHIVQDYTLQDHLLNTLTATQQSVYYRMLNEEEQFRVSTAAFFHDLRKKTGPTHFREVARICVDPHHPGRSAESVLEYLPSLGYTPAQVADIYRIIDHHQLLGNMARPDGDPTTPKAIGQAASLLGSSSVLKMLRALTEGDVRCVRFDVPGRTWFDEDMSRRVYQFSELILKELVKREQSKR